MRTWLAKLLYNWADKLEPVKPTPAPAPIRPRIFSGPGVPPAPPPPAPPPHPVDP